MKFKISDRVRIKCVDGLPCEEDLRGHTGTVKKYRDDLVVVLVEGDTQEVLYEEDQLELVEDEGKKFDDKKPRWDLLPLDTIEECVKVLTLGAAKYGDDNWKKVEAIRYFAATMRHLTAWQKGEKGDPETGISHLAHAICSLVFLLWKEQNK